MEYKHIRDCWNQIEKTKSIAKLEKLFLDFPRWSGDWEIEINAADDLVIITNTWYDENLETEDETIEKYDGLQFTDYKKYKNDLVI